MSRIMGARLRVHALAPPIGTRVVIFEGIAVDVGRRGQAVAVRIAVAPPAPGFGRAAPFAVRAFLIGRANEEAEPLFGVLPRTLAGDLRAEFLGCVRLGALGPNDARPGRQVEQTGGGEGSPT